ncbi:hypothetical protein LWI29_018336 [Acer saccharum]|uniref:Chaperone DnaJ C-terminal domain-containing protein n=1 Tax=Acer saccharum TaxID=4024 RepID=A0AA39RMH5_ACESA|nr:hypothetical protein LWI29_018336 [Acer saccharum]KAK1555026.1 hypothetical protein Q3G72_020804 [Acer saccharum]
MVDHYPQIGIPKGASFSDSDLTKKKASSIGTIIKFYKLLITRWRHNKKSSFPKDTNFQETTPKDVGQEETMNGVHCFGCVGGGNPTAPRGFSKHRSVDGSFPFMPSPLSRSGSRRSPSPTPSSLYRNLSRKSNDSNVFMAAPLSRNASRRSSTPIMFSNSMGMVKPPPIEKKLECTLEELCFGCTKKIKITRDVITDSGEIIQEEELLTIKVKPGWKKGTKITFEGMGNEVPGAYPADIAFVIAEKRHPMFRREGDDLELAIEIPLVKALTGCDISVPLLGGERISLMTDNIIHPGEERIMPGQGMPTKLQGKRGDLKLLFLVQFPKELTDEQRSDVLSILEDSA